MGEVTSEDGRRPALQPLPGQGGLRSHRGEIRADREQIGVEKARRLVRKGGGFAGGFSGAARARQVIGSSSGMRKADALRILVEGETRLEEL